MDIRDYQSGRYENRDKYRAFMPTKICQEWVSADAGLIELLGRADRALGGLDALAQLIPDIDFFIHMYVAKEATQSSRIEGTRTNIEDAFKDEDDLNPEERNDWVEVQNYIQAIRFAIRMLDHLPLSNLLLCGAHAVLMQGARGEHKMPGEFRTSQNWIGASLKNAVFVPPHHEHIPDLMHDLERFLHADDIRTHPLLRIAIAHYQFETIHPFLDGNGRVGRLMISLYLASEGLLKKPALYLSDYFERNRTAYIDHLIAARDKNRLQDWLIFFLQGVEETATASTGAFRAILALKAWIDGNVLPRFNARGQDNAQTLMRNIYKHPMVSVNLVAKWIDSTPSTASKLISSFVEYGVLKEITGQQRNRLFVFHEYFAIFRNDHD